MKFLTIVIAAFIYLASVVNAQILATVPIMNDGPPHNPHDYSFGPIAVPVGATLVRFVFDTRDNLTQDMTMTVFLTRSLNGGATLEAGGGAVFNATAQPADFVAVLPEPSNNSRLVEGRITLFGGKWKGRAFIEIE